MRIQKPGTESRQEIARPRGKAEKNDRFSKVLETKRKESAPEFNLPAENQNTALPGTACQPESIASARAPVDVEQLASEIVDHLSTHQAGGVRSVEIQFNSRTLEGLRVSVSSEQGSIAISFLTPVDRIAKLVQKDLGDLRAALESKGIRVGRLAVNRGAG